MLSVYWNEYQLVKKKKYLVYFVGNMSPPHKGHLSLIEPYFNQKHVKILIHLAGNEKKHNISLQTTKEILSIYLKNVSNVTVEKFDPHFLNIYNCKKIDFLLFVRGNENLYSTIKTDYLETFSGLIKNLRKKGIISLALVRERIPKISSTEMCMHVYDEDLLDFLPEKLTDEEKDKIKNILRNIN